MTDPDKTRPISPAFGSSAAFVIDRLEGGAAMVSDSGGLTKWGISKKAHPKLDIERLTREDALDVYHANYWAPLNADALPRGLDLIVFDMAVNTGLVNAVKLLQRVLRIREDGQVGPQTIAAAKAYKPQSELRVLVNELRMRTYEDLAKRKPFYLQYLYGWRCRVMRVADEAGRVGGAA